MQFDRLLSSAMTRAVGRIARSGLGIKIENQTEATEPEADVAADDDLRGSGSWANEWDEARAAAERGKRLPQDDRKAAKAAAEPAAEGEGQAQDDAAPRRRNGPAPADMPAEIPEGSIHARALLSRKEVQLYNWIADKIETEAPSCSLHARVALSAFLDAQVEPGTANPLNGLAVDLLIIDEAGAPVAALVRENRKDPIRQIAVFEALLDADVTIVDLPSKGSLARLWAEIQKVLPSAATRADMPPDAAGAA